MMITPGARRAILLATSCIASAATAQTAAPPAAAAGPSALAADDRLNDLDMIVVTGTTTRGRTLITASADITSINREELDRRAPRSTADLLELVPGIFVEGTAGELSNNYSVRGLQGGGQRFIQFEEDGMPVIYGGGGADFWFAQDLTIDRFEAVKGGSSGVLTVNGAGATINFISRRPNFERAEGVARLTAFNYRLLRTDVYYSMPIAENTAFNVGGFIQTSPGVRSNPFNYQTYQFKAMLEHRFDDGGFVRLSGHVGDRSAAFYATQPYALENGRVTGIPGFDTQFGNIGGEAFGNVSIPNSPSLDPDGFREFRLSQGVRVQTNWIRLDVEKPLTDEITLFGRARYLGQKSDFNGLFPGSGTGNAGLASATDYLTAGANSPSPIAGLLNQGLTAFPGAVRFGIRGLRDGVVIPSTNTAALRGLAGNGLLQQTTLNHDAQSGHDFASNFGGRWQLDRGEYQNSLTVGMMVYRVKRRQNQSATAALLNDVSNNSQTYDVVALDGGNNIVGTLTDNAILSYGNWGVGIRETRDTSVNIYVNDELRIGDLRLDGGIRYEHLDSDFDDGSPLLAGQLPSTAGFVLSPQPDGRVCADPRPVGLSGIIGPSACTTWSGQFNRTSRRQSAVSWTFGANYLIRPDLSVYARYADGFQTNGVNPITRVELIEAGVRFQQRWLSASLTLFRTNFNNQFYNFQDVDDPRLFTTFEADLSTTGVEMDATLRPVPWFSLDFQGVFQRPRLSNLRIGGVAQGDAFEGNRPERTPDTLFTITPAVQLPDNKGQVYARYKRIGRIFADSGNALALPAYGVTSIGFMYNLTDRLMLQFDAENIFNQIGLTEGNPRQGQVQNVVNGLFYARGIVGPTYGGSITMKF